MVAEKSLQPREIVRGVAGEAQHRPTCGVAEAERRRPEDVAERALPGLARGARMGRNRGMPPFDPSRLTSRRKDAPILARARVVAAQAA
ncbi:MAG: hypothetical protein QXS92_02765, partial [Thermofilum sp.]